MHVLMHHIGRYENGSTRDRYSDAQTKQHTYSSLTLRIRGEPRCG